jgi:hypothetical protein
LTKEEILNLEGVIIDTKYVANFDLKEFIGFKIKFNTKEEMLTIVKNPNTFKGKLKEILSDDQVSKLSKYEYYEIDSQKYYI